MIAHKRTILGIDPGTKIMGYGVLEINTNHKMICKSVGVIKLDIIKKQEHTDKLFNIYASIEELILKHNPQELAIESPFLGKNPQSALKLGRAQGIVIAACLKYKLSIAEYMPKKIKMSITGNGNAEKEQVYKMLEKILSVEIEAKYLDATDALSVAVCHFFQSNPIPQINKRNFKNWGDFIKNNPDKIKM